MKEVPSLLMSWQNNLCQCGNFNAKSNMPCILLQWLIWHQTEHSHFGDLFLTRLLFTLTEVGFCQWIDICLSKDKIKAE